MALARRVGGNRVSGSIWPGFVDAMTALLLVLMFVLTIFVILQYQLQQTISGQETELDDLALEVTSLAQALGLEQQRVANLEEVEAELNTRLDAAAEEAASQRRLISTLSQQVSDQESELAARQAQITDFEAQVASLIARNTEAAAEIAALEGERDRLISSEEALQLSLAQARSEIDTAAEQARLAAARREALEALVADLESDQRSLSADLSALQSERADLAAERDALASERDALADERDDLDSRTAALLAERDRLAEELSDEEIARIAEAAAAERLRERLQDSNAELTAMTLRLEEERRRAEETLTLLAAARAERDELETTAAERLSEAERQALLLAEAERSLAQEEEISTEAQREVAALNAQIGELRSQLNQLQGLLDDARARDAEAQVRIQTLGSDLNAALARAAAEAQQRAEAEAEKARLEAARAEQLEAYRSEFFGQLRQLLGNRDGVNIVGDRFVFSSEVLFEVGEANLAAAGRAQIAEVAGILREVSDQIPDGIDWILRVDGHTDDTPIAGSSTWQDNWELSQARALSVVRFMIDDLGFPPQRLAAAGFGEYRPVAPGTSPEARAANRRIELKLTER